MLLQSVGKLRASSLLRTSDALLKTLADDSLRILSSGRDASSSSSSSSSSPSSSVCVHSCIADNRLISTRCVPEGTRRSVCTTCVLGFRRHASDMQCGGGYGRFQKSGRGFRTHGGMVQDSVVEVPPLGAETILEGTVAALLKQPGDVVVEDDVIAQLETDKVTIDVKYQKSVPGTIKAIHFAEGDTVEVGQAFADVEETPGAEVAAHVVVDEPQTEKKKEDAPSVRSEPLKKATQAVAEASPPAQQRGERPERRVKMTRLRKRIAERLKGAQNTYAMLTTFNEVDMTHLMEMRNAYKDEFLESHGVKLGFMSAFVKASANALQYVPAVNGVIEEDDILYRDYYDVSVAVSTPKGLVVPVLRNVDTMSFSDVEKKINELGRKARDGALSIDEMAGGTFTISNGGVFGSLMGTPIINPPQSAILGMHATKLRPAVVDGQVVARPMMYLALTYDHRLVDGREAVTFLKRIKEIIEDPRRLLLDV